MRKCLFATLAIILLIIPTVSALQVSPAVKSFTLEPSAVDTYELRIINDQRIELEVSLAAQGDYAGLVTIEPSSFSLAADEGSRRATVTVTHPPENELTPGRNTIPLRVSGTNRGGQFGGAVSLIHNLHVYRAYDGVFFEGVLSAEDATSPDDPVAFVLSLVNRGEQTGRAEGHVVVAGTVPLTAEFSAVEIGPGQEGKMTAELGGLARGAYDATALLTYQDRGETVTNEYATTVTVGAPAVTMRQPIAELIAGEIAQVDVPVTVHWNRELDVNLRLELHDGETLLAQATSATVTLAPNAEGELRAFLEVPELAAGDYRLSATVQSEQELETATWLVPVAAPAAPLPVAVAQAFPLWLVLALIVLAIFAFLLWRQKDR